MAARCQTATTTSTRRAWRGGEGDSPTSATELSARTAWASLARGSSGIMPRRATRVGRRRFLRKRKRNPGWAVWRAIACTEPKAPLAGLGVGGEGSFRGEVLIIAAPRVSRAAKRMGAAQLGRSWGWGPVHAQVVRLAEGGHVAHGAHVASCRMENRYACSHLPASPPAPQDARPRPPPPDGIAMGRCAQGESGRSAAPTGGLVLHRMRQPELRHQEPLPQLALQGGSRPPGGGGGPSGKRVALRGVRARGVRQCAGLLPALRDSGGAYGRCRRTA